MSTLKVKYNDEWQNVGATGTVLTALSENVGILNSRVDAIKVSNPNLLDNPFFSVNQRGATTGASWDYFIDRWKSSSTSITCGTGYVTIPYDTRIYQRLEESLTDYLDGKTVTISVMKSDGSILTSSVVCNSDDTFHYNEVQGVRIGTHRTTVGYEEFIVHNMNSDPVTIKAVKVELGSQSTLAYDSAPDYASELLKCQRYFYRIKASTYFMGFVRNSTNLYSQFMPFPVTMRKTPSITGTINYVRSTGSWGLAQTITSTMVSLSTIDGFVICIEPESGFSNFQSTHLHTSDISFSSEL